MQLILVVLIPMLLINSTDNPFRDEEKDSKLIDDILNKTKTELIEANKICGKTNNGISSWYYSYSPNMWCHTA